MPKYLLCHVHFCLMFIKKFKIFSKIETSIGSHKIYQTFLVNATTSHDAVDDNSVRLLFRSWAITAFKGLTASKINAFHYLALQFEALAILLHKTHCTNAEKLLRTFKQ